MLKIWGRNNSINVQKVLWACGELALPFERMADKQFSMGDIPMGVAAFRWYNMAIERPALKNLDVWYARLCARPAFQQHCMRLIT